jgi:hypothetical protein
MTLVVLLLVPVALMSLPVHGLMVSQLWRTRRERPGSPRPAAQGPAGPCGDRHVGLRLVALISLGYGRAGAWVFLAVFGSVAVALVSVETPRFERCCEARDAGARHRFIRRKGQIQLRRLGEGSACRLIGGGMRCGGAPFPAGAAGATLIA